MEMGWKEERSPRPVASPGFVGKPQRLRTLNDLISVSSAPLRMPLA
jgi:hypothetical protein